MRLYASEQIKAWDQFTVQKEGIASFQLMQRAAKACYDWVVKRYSPEIQMQVLCGPGNNGGDGLLIAAYLQQRNYQVEVYAMDGGNSADRAQALTYAEEKGVKIQALNAFIPKHDVIILDALFGHGMTRPITGDLAQLINGINASGVPVISMDIPSGMPSEPQEEYYNTFIKNATVLTFQSPKLSFFLDEYGGEIAHWQVVNIGLHPDFDGRLVAVWMDESFIRSLFQEKERFSHKGSFGNALLIGGSSKYPGAIALSALGCLASGAGKTFIASPKESALSCQAIAPEAIYLQGTGTTHLNAVPDCSAYSAIGIGPGLGQEKVTEMAILSCFKEPSNWVIDADAVNILARNPKANPEGNTVITPHPGEFDRLAHKHSDMGSRWITAERVSREKNWVIVLKGAYTTVFFPDGRRFVNGSGNAGLAKGGSGDVLCGLMTGLIARGYSVEDGVLIAVYLHGMAADRLNLVKSKDSMKATDLIPEIEGICKQWEN